MPSLLPQRYTKPELAQIDAGQQESEILLSRLERELNAVYGQAAKEMEQKALDYLSWFQKTDAIKRKQWKDGKLTKKEYQQWRYSHMLTGKRWFEYANVLATDLTDTNLIAASIMNGYIPEAYAVGINYSTYNIEQSGMIDTSFTLYSKQTVEYLVRENPQLLPTARVNIPKDMQWNRSCLNSAITQGILQGESIGEIAQRLANVSTMDEKAAIRNARTMVTSAENAGRNDGFVRADNMGINLVIEWSATLDKRTRTSHRMLDGTTRKVGEYFVLDDETLGTVKIAYPADMGGAEYKVPPSMVYNCRCTMQAWVKGFEHTNEVKYSPKMGSMTYEEWKKAKPEYKPKNVVNRK